MDGVGEDASCAQGPLASRARHGDSKMLTSYRLRALEVLIGVYVARGESKVEAHENQEQIGSSPHVASIMKGLKRH